MIKSFLLRYTGACNKPLGTRFMLLHWLTHERVNLCSRTNASSKKQIKQLEDSQESENEESNVGVMASFTTTAADALEQPYIEKLDHSPRPWSGF